jgi:hypothetical protein
MVFPPTGLMRYAPRKSDFPFIQVSKDQPLPPNSLSAKGGGSVGFISAWSEMSAGVWIAPSARIRGKQLYGQYLVQTHAFRMTMLTLDDISSDDEPDEDDELGSTGRRVVAVN